MEYEYTEWFDLNYKNSQYDNEYTCHVLSEQEIAGGTLEGTDNLDILETISKTGRIVWDYQQAKINKLEQEKSVSRKTLEIIKENQKLKTALIAIRDTAATLEDIKNNVRLVLVELEER